LQSPFREVLAPPAVRIVGGRAFAEMPAAIEVRAVLDGVTADLVSCTRILYRLERREGRWGIVALDCAYERDTATPAVPGEHLTIGPEDLTPHRAPYAILAWPLARRGYEVSPDLLGDDRPEQTAAFYAETRKWLQGSGEPA